MGGRESLASRDLGAGDLLLVAPPVVLGPGRQEVAVCLGCLQAVPGLAPCSSCSWPVCSSSCSSSPHHSQECQLLKAAGEKCKIKNFTEKTTALDFITPLRLLMKGV